MHACTRARVRACVRAHVCVDVEAISTCTRDVHLVTMVIMNVGGYKLGSIDLLSHQPFTQFAQVVNIN